MKNHLKLITLFIVVSVFLLSALVVSAPAPPDVAQDIVPVSSLPLLQVTDKQEMGNSESPIFGELPQLSSPANEAYGQKINGVVNNVYNNAVAKMQANQGKSVAFSYKTYRYQNQYLSVVIHSEIDQGNTSSNDVTTIVADLNRAQIYTLKDLLGEEAYGIGNQVILNAIKNATPGTYFTEADGDNFKTLDAHSKFYIEDQGQLTFIFNKYEIAPGYVGTPTFTMTFTGGRAPFVVDKIITFVPLRQVAEANGYKVTWDGSSKTTLLQNKQQQVSVSLGNTQYIITNKGDPSQGKRNNSKYAPVLIHGETYVSISFVKDVLGIMAEQLDHVPFEFLPDDD